MNAPHHLPQQLTLGQTASPQVPRDDDEINLLEYWDIIVDNRWVVAIITAIVFVIGLAYALLAKPVYESNLLIQVEDSAGSSKNLLGDAAASFFDMKTPAAAEMEILRSRMIIGQAVDSTLLYVETAPRYLPIVGNWLARHADGLSIPGLFGLGGWVSGTEQIKVAAFDVPAGLEDSKFRVTARADGEYALSGSDIEPLDGKVGQPLVHSMPNGTLTLTISALKGKPGAQFNLMRKSRLEVIEDLQQRLQLIEKGKQSGVIDARLQDNDRSKLTWVLNEIGRLYVKQNVERKAAEAQKTLEFLGVQLPQIKKQLDVSEDAYSRYRNGKGTISLDDEAKAVLGRNVDLQSKLVEAQQKRLELVSRFTNEHPSVVTLDQQIAAWNREIATLNERVKVMPAVQQDALRLERDVKVNADLYQQLQNNALQLQLIREGKTGNVRLIDSATIPEEPVKPKRALVLALAALLGVLAGVGAAITRNAFFRGIRSAQEIEAHTGLNVYSTIPLSSTQEAIAKQVAEKQPGVHILADAAPSDMAVESLRSLRTALQFAMLEAGNNRILITGATPGIGKSFVSANFSAVLASSGKRVLLIDADLRRGHLNQYFGVPRNGGLSELITGSMQPDAAIRRSVLPNLDLISTGTLPPNPAELMTSSAFANLLDTLSANYDLVVVDTAPVLVAADTLSVSMHVGTLLLVARAGATQIGELHESARRLAHAGRSANGVIFNAVDLTRRHYGSYGYKYGGYKYRYYSYGTPTL